MTDIERKPGETLSTAIKRACHIGSDGVGSFYDEPKAVWLLADLADYLDARLARIERQLGIGEGTGERSVAVLIAEAFAAYIRWQPDGDWQTFLDYVSNEVRDATPVKPPPVEPAPRPEAVVETAEATHVQLTKQAIYNQLEGVSAMGRSRIRGCVTDFEEAIRADERRKLNAPGFAPLLRSRAELAESERDELRTKLEAAERELESIKSGIGCGRCAAYMVERDTAIRELEKARAERDAVSAERDRLLDDSRRFT